jgi:hypothetical protein
VGSKHRTWPARLAGLCAQSLVAGALLVGCAALLDLSPLVFDDGVVAEGGDDDRVVVDASDAGVDAARDSGPMEAGRPWRYVFVSSEARDGTLSADGGPSGRASADTWCKALAEQGSPAIRGLSWVAWLSLMAGPSSALGRITGTGGKVPEYRLLNGTVVFPAGFGFDAAPPSSPLQLDENGNNPGALIVWTGTDRRGDVTSNTCLDWTTRVRVPSGTIGTSTDQQGWTVNPTVTQLCDGLGHVYCFEAP